MANNPNVNKVIYGNTTVMDISDTTATEGDVVSGKIFYKASGERSQGSAVIPKVSSGDIIDFGAVGAANGDSSASGISLAIGKYISAEYDVSNVNSVLIRYVANSSYNSTYGQLGYEIDGVETAITDYATTWKSKTVDLTNATKFNMWGKIVQASSGSRYISGWLVFS